MNNKCMTYPKTEHSSIRETKFNRLTVDVNPNHEIVVPFMYPPQSIRNLGKLQITHSKVTSQGQDTDYKLSIE